MGRHARQNKMMIKAVEKIEALGLNKRGPCANEMTFFFYSQLEMDFSDVQNQESAQYNTFNSCEEKNFFSGQNGGKEEKYPVFFPSPLVHLSLLTRHVSSSWKKTPPSIWGL